MGGCLFVSTFVWKLKKKKGLGRFLCLLGPTRRRKGTVTSRGHTQTQNQKWSEREEEEHISRSSLTCHYNVSRSQLPNLRFRIATRPNTWPSVTVTFYSFSMLSWKHAVRYVSLFFYYYFFLFSFFFFGSLEVSELLTRPRLYLGLKIDHIHLLPFLTSIILLSHNCHPQNWV